MTNVSLDVDDRRLDSVMSDVARGKHRIPEFQREFVWDRTDVVDLFDSIYRSFPIGSFFSGVSHRTCGVSLEMLRV